MTTDTLFANWTWTPPADWGRIRTIDTHTGGEPLRIIVSGLPPLSGQTVLEKRRFFMDNLDHLRTGLLREPRGHADMYGAVLTAPSDDAHLDVFFLNTEGYSPMCGHAIIAIGKVALETGLVKLADGEELVINVPPGRNYVSAEIRNGTVGHVSFRNVPSFVALRDATVEVPGLGSIRFDVAFGGAFYAIVDGDQIPADLAPDHYHALIDLGRRVKRAIVANFPIKHPLESDLDGLFGVIFTGASAAPGVHSRNVTVFEDGEVDRSSTGTGVSARAALLYAQGKLKLNEQLIIESILGSTMTVEVVGEATSGDYEAIIPQVGGTAHIMGQSDLFFDAADPMANGFMLR